MSYKVNFDALDSLCININTQVSEWINDINSVGEILNAILNGNNITGSGAENIKSYIQTVHAAVIQSLILILQSHAQNCLMYKSDYQQNIDTSLHAVIKCEELFDIRKQLATKRSEMWGVDSSIINALTNVSDLIYTNLDSSDDMDTLYGTINTTLLNLESDISNLESSHLNNDFFDVQNMISSLKVFINDQISRSRGYLVEYTPHQLANSDVYANLFDANQVLVASQSERTDEFQLACEHENNRAELLEAEAAQKREEEGWWSAFAAVGTIVVGTVAIVCTAGMATPIVVTAVVAGGSSILYGASNLVEAGQDIYYGSIGDATTVAFNPIRDTVFAGNQELYDIWGEISVTVAGFVVPVGQAYTTAKAAGSTTKVVVTTVGKAAVKEVMEDTAVNWVSSGAGSAVMNLTGDANASRLFGLGAGFLAGNLNSLDDVSDVARKMDNVTDTTEIFDDVNDVTRKIDDLDNLDNVSDVTGKIDDLDNLDNVSGVTGKIDDINNATVTGRIDNLDNLDNVTDATRKLEDVTDRTIGVNPLESVTPVDYGDHFCKQGRKKALKPNVEYTDANGYRYRTDEMGRITHVEGQLELGAGDRNAYAQRTVGGDDRLLTDDGGHLIASRFNGSGEIDNLIPQSSNINRVGGEWYAMEQEWANALDNKRTVSVDIQPRYSNNSMRPDSFEVRYWIDGEEYIKNIINS